MQLKICEALVANLFLQFELPGSLSTKCGFDVLPPHSLGATGGELFGVLLRFPQGRLNFSEMNCGPLSVLSVWGTPKRANIGWRLLMTFVLVVDLRITTSKCLL